MYIIPYEAECYCHPKRGTSAIGHWYHVGWKLGSISSYDAISFTEISVASEEFFLLPFCDDEFHCGSLIFLKKNKSARFIRSDDHRVNPNCGSEDDVVIMERSDARLAVVIRRKVNSARTM